ncbi:hypothetical protein [Sorangium atrum]|uniref:Integrase n=1 Tax=Sorangium atrum TaxID=2995308 RepID=A0ABT5CFE6_9BACT|nr:hypothetical protein [Sorangium aterium]MDC0683811.1 hypothetical protein [Sorangium aterium]
MNLAAGKTGEWSTDRTGYKSSQGIYRYERQARTYGELNAGALKPLREASPELAEVGVYLTHRSERRSDVDLTRRSKHRKPDTPLGRQAFERLSCAASSIVPAVVPAAPASLSG